MVVVACGDDADSSRKPHDAGSDDAAAQASLDAAAPDAAVIDATIAADGGRDAYVRPDDAIPRPTNESFDTARALEDGKPIYQHLFDATQADYYKWEAKAGHFYVMQTDYGPFSPDNIITVYDPDRHAIARNDEGQIFSGDHIDARVIVRATRDGTYFAKVEDEVTPPEAFDGMFNAPLNYSFKITEIHADTPGFALEVSDATPKSAALQPDDQGKMSYVTLLGELGKDDEDSFALSGVAGDALIGALLPTGADGDGSSADKVGVSVVAEKDQHVVAAIEHDRGQLNIHPPVGEGSYTVHVNAHGDPGDNGFYAIDVVLLKDNPRESDAANDAPDDAQDVALTTQNGHRGLLLSHLPESDVDYYKFSATKGGSILIGCEGESGGSGVRGLTAELFDSPAHSLAKAQETSTANLLIDGVMVQQTGTHYLKLSSTTPAASADGAIEPWARCVVISN
jgi:hypothetical protein